MKFLDSSVSLLVTVNLNAFTTFSSKAVVIGVVVTSKSSPISLGRIIVLKVVVPAFVFLYTALWLSIN